jgi:hypothetical protein
LQIENAFIADFRLMFADTPGTMKALHLKISIACVRVDTQPDFGCVCAANPKAIGYKGEALFLPSSPRSPSSRSHRGIITKSKKIKRLSAFCG